MDELVKIALVGTSKHTSIAVADVDHPAEDLLHGVAADDREHAFLLRAGARAVCDQCGHVPRTDVPAVAPSPPDDVPACSARLIQLLRETLAAEDKALLVEFLRSLAEHGLLVPPELLPQVLSASDGTIREAVLPVVGERGRWLAQFRSEWEWGASGAFASADPEVLRQTWDEGASGERRQALAALRRSDPALARDWLAAAMGNTKADERASLLETFQDGLSPTDEPFLEERLDDRSENVRRVASQLLVRLPESALAARMRERGEAMLAAEWKGLVRKKLKLVCAPPQEIDKNWERDGIPKKPPSGRGKRAFWAEWVLALVPPSHWTGKLAAEPAALIEAVVDDDFAEAVLAGWTEAAARFAAADAGSAEWLTPLADHWCQVAAKAAGAARNEALARIAMLVAALPQAAAEKTVLRLLHGSRKETDPIGLHFLSDLPRPWTVDFGVPFVELVRGALKRPNGATAFWMNALATAARALPKEAFDRALDPWEVPAVEPGTWQAKAGAQAVDRCIDTIRLRQSFHTEADISQRSVQPRPPRVRRAKAVAD
jgi:hypothetical protein